MDRALIKLYYFKKLNQTQYHKIVLQYNTGIDMLVTKCVGTKEYTQTNNPWIEGSHLKSQKRQRCYKTLKLSPTLHSTMHGEKQSRQVVNKGLRPKTQKKNEQKATLLRSCRATKSLF